jgi:hypothetical protein
MRCVRIVAVFGFGAASQPIEDKSPRHKKRISHIVFVGQKFAESGPPRR